MAHIPLNRPCPCGSGKKYKHCCRSKDAARQRKERAKSKGVEVALKWLLRHHDEAVTEAIEFVFFSSLGAEAMNRCAQLDPGLQQMVLINAHDWLLAEGDIEVDGDLRPVSELVLGPGGPLLEATQREWLTRMAETPIRLWEVQESRPGEGLWVRDARDRESPRLWVAERSASQSLMTWDVLGARLVPWEDHWEISGSVYPLPRDQVAGLVAAMEEACRDASGDLEPRELPWLEGQLVAAAWLRHILAEPALPELVDQGTGDPILLCTDHYDVLDEDRLAAALAAQPDVEGDRREGWSRFVELGGGMSRRLLAINPRGGRRIEAYAQTRRRADEGREWLQRVAGDAIRFRSREIVDPLSVMQSGAGKGSPGPRGRGSDEIPRTTELAQELYEQLYSDWADQPVPFLGGKTPGKAARSEAGRAQLIELLKSYENHEARQARTEGRKPASFLFLWEAVGLDREEALG